MKKQFTFIESMIKVGVIGFGGGNALIPVLEQEVVNEKKLVSKDEYDKSVIAATLTPGALPVEIASGIGLHGRRHRWDARGRCIDGSSGSCVYGIVFNAA